MSAENTALVRRWIKEVWSKGNLDAVDELVAPSYANHDPVAPMPESGREGFKKHVTEYRTAFPDLAFTIDDVLGEGHKVTVRWTAHGTHKGTLLGKIQPTGKEVTTTGTSILRIAGGKVAEEWVHWDALGMMQQLGVVPMLGEPRGKTASAKR